MLATLPPQSKLTLVFLGKFEAPKGYNTVYNNRMKDMPKPLTSMTFDEVVADGPRRTREFGSSACGRYQFMRDTLDKPNTLADLKGELKLSGSELFTPDLQDKLGHHLLVRRGLLKFLAGKMTLATFALNLAKEWASLPVLRNMKGAKRQIKRGQSYYAGDGQNKSLMSAETLEAFLATIAPGVAVSSPVASDAPAPLSPVATVEPAPAPGKSSVGGFLGWIASRFGSKPATLAPTEADKALPGDPIVRMVQRELQSRFYYTSKVDGWDGTNTRDAVASSRKDNGMGDGGIDQEFLLKLSTFGPKPVSASRSTATIGKAFAEAKAQAPDIVAPVNTLWKVGAGLLTYVGIDTAKTEGIIDKAKIVTDQGSDVLNSVQTAIATVSSAADFVVNNQKLIFTVIAIWVLFRSANGALAFAIRFKTAFGL